MPIFKNIIAISIYFILIDTKSCKPHGSGGGPHVSDGPYDPWVKISNLKCVKISDLNAPK